MGEQSAKSTLRARIARLGERVFPERQIMIRTDGRISYARISRRVQVTLAALLLAGAGWTAFASFSVYSHGEVLADKDLAIAKANRAYSGLLAEVESYQQKFSGLTGELEENHSLMLRLVEQNATLQQNLKSVKTRLSSTEVERQQVIAMRETLGSQLREIEGRMRELASRNFSLKGNLTTMEDALKLALSERNQAREEGVQLRRRVEDLEVLLADLQDSEQEVLQRLTDHTVERIDDLEQVLARTGIDLKAMLDGELERGQGGPFIEARPDDRPEERMRAALFTLDAHIDRWAGLRRLVTRLPLISPLDYYYVSSSYGKRRDPVNSKWAMHYGLDMATSRNAPVYVTASGTVTYAGWKGKYGKLVEIDHGNGIITRYGHLAKVLVKKGDKVESRDKLGLVGSTGRSTGPHVHYEVMVNGKTVDPLKFIKAGKHVFKG